MSLAGVCVLLVSCNTLFDGLPVGMKACLELSFVVPMWDVAPLLAMSDGMEPLRTLRWISCVQFVMSRKMLICLGGE